MIEWHIEFSSMKFKVLIFLNDELLNLHIDYDKKNQTINNLIDLHFSWIWIWIFLIWIQQKRSMALLNYYCVTIIFIINLHRREYHWNKYSTFVICIHKLGTIIFII